MRQVSFFLALIFSYMTAGYYTGHMMPFVGKFIENPKIVFFISFGILFALGAIFFFLLGKLLHLVMQLTLVTWFDKMLGFFLGVVKAALVTSFLYMVMSSGPSSAHDLVKESITSRFLSQGSEFVQKMINDPDLQERFLPKKPAIPEEKEPVGSLLGKDEKEAGDSRIPIIDSHFFNDRKEK